MPKPKEKPLREVRLIYCEVGANSNKYWEAFLYANNSVFSQWGRVGGNGQEKLYPNGGEHLLEKKMREKLKKGYTHQKTLGDVETPKSLNRESLKDMALKQIAFDQPQVQNFISYLVESNIHQIAEANISYNAHTGLFQTPLGVVTKEGLEEARQLLSKISSLQESGQKNSSSYFSTINSYFRIIPQHVGHKFDPDTFVGNERKLRKQLELLDALEASYAAIQKGAYQKTDPQKEEKIFDLEISLMPAEDPEFARIRTFFEASKDPRHSRSVTGATIKHIYRIDRHPIRDAAIAKATILGNVKELWHGSNHANLLSILQGGLRCTPPSSAKIAGKAFGNGIYFADCSTKSLNYSTGSWHGTKHSRNFLFLANVTLGVSHTPPRATFRKPEGTYDSISALQGKTDRLKNNEYIVFANDMVDLRYLIEIN